MHMWGDEFFKQYGDDLYAAERWIASELKRRTWCSLSSKEKYGTIRYEWVFPPKGWRNYYIDLPIWLFLVKGSTEKYQRRIWSWTSHDSRIYRAWERWGWRTLWKIVQEAAIKWPHLRVELCQDIAVHEDIVGKDVHNQYWTSGEDK